MKLDRQIKYLQIGSYMKFNHVIIFNLPLFLYKETLPRSICLEQRTRGEFPPYPSWIWILNPRPSTVPLLLERCNPEADALSMLSHESSSSIWVLCTSKKMLFSPYK